MFQKGEEKKKSQSWQKMLAKNGTYAVEYTEKQMFKFTEKPDKHLF